MQSPAAALTPSLSCWCDPPSINPTCMRSQLFVTHSQTCFKPPQCLSKMMPPPSSQAVLRAAESFYDIVGGLLGYQLTTIELIQTGEVAAFRKDISANATARAPLGSDPGPPPLDAFWEVESADFSHAEDEAEQPAYCVPPGINLIEDEERAVRFAFKCAFISPLGSTLPDALRRRASAALPCQPR